MQRDLQTQDRVLAGMFAVSKAGHDKDHLYIIIDKDETYVYIANGKNKTVGRPKKKKYKHIQVIHFWDVLVAEKMNQLTLSNKDVSDAIERYSSKQN